MELYESELYNKYRGYFSEREQEDGIYIGLSGKRLVLVDGFSARRGATSVFCNNLQLIFNGLVDVKLSILTRNIDENMIRTIIQLSESELLRVIYGQNNK